MKHQSEKHADLFLLFALCEGQKTAMKMKWKKKFSAEKSILGAGRQRMEMSALCFSLECQLFKAAATQQQN